jgi:hypothetical protein
LCLHVRPLILKCLHHLLCECRRSWTFRSLTSLQYKFSPVIHCLYTKLGPQYTADGQTFELSHTGAVCQPRQLFSLCVVFADYHVCSYSNVCLLLQEVFETACHTISTCSCSSDKVCSFHLYVYTHTCLLQILRWQVRASSYNSNKLTNQMQQFYKFIT